MIKTETLEQLGEILRHLRRGQAAGIHNDVFRLFFPPMVEDGRARRQADTFARSNGCVIAYRPEESAVYFIKPALAHAAIRQVGCFFRRVRERLAEG